MKKINVILLSVLMVFSVLLLPACSGSTPVVGEKGKHLISAETMDKNVREFLQVSDTNPNGIGGNRTATSDSATAAAERLYAKYTATTTVGEETVKVYPDLVTEKFEFTHGSESQLAGRTGYNIAVRYKSKSNPNKKQVLIGTSYDSVYGDVTKDVVTNTSTGAMKGATSVGLIMSLIDYVNSGSYVDPGVDIVFCYFAGAYGCIGSGKYLRDNMKPDERTSTLLMINVQRLGGEEVYVYSDEVRTDHNDFILKTSNKDNFGFKVMPKSTPIMEQQSIASIPYTHWGLLGDHAPFLDNGMAVANIFSGKIGGLNLGFNEIGGKANLINTADDTYANLKNHRGNYAEQMADTATVILSTIGDADFVLVMEGTKANTYDYSFVTGGLWVSLGMLGLIALLVVLLVLLVKHFEKKYPFVPQVKHLKIAVFGMDYETKNDTDIYVDIKKPKNPFDGY